jgi:hypothetical protein
MAEKEDLHGREAMVPVHGNRILAHLIFRTLDLSKFNQADLDIAATLDRAKVITTMMVLLTCNVISEDFPDSYLASLFKNRTKCEEIVDEVLRQLSSKAVDTNSNFQENPKAKTGS